MLLAFGFFYVLFYIPSVDGADGVAILILSGVDGVDGAAKTKQFFFNLFLLSHEF